MVKKIFMTRFLIIVTISFSICYSCNRHKQDILSKDKLIEILADLHLSDGILDQSEYKKYHLYDTVIYQEYIYEKYGVSKADVDSSIAYYASELEDITEIYEKVTELLQHKSAMLSDSLKNVSGETESVDLWNMKTRWEMPRDGIHENIPVDIKISKPGTYTFKADFKVYPDDGSVNPRVNLYFFKEDSSSKNGIKSYFKPEFLDKNAVFKSVTITNILHDTSFTHIKGQVLSHTNMNDLSWRKHSEVKNIKLLFDPLQEEEKEIKDSIPPGPDSNLVNVNVKE